ncbi:hypothetical protein DRO28_03455 [Candidatus Bathyarchaeota archaeon]|nr:MAG: hypothetical protein DRO28_03455 [Candidatus Bathyarchaeota archaeon]
MNVVDRESANRYRWLILCTAWLSYSMAFFTRLSIPPLAPFIQADLNLTRAQVGLFVTAAYLGYMAMQVPSGWLTDSIGVRKMLLIGQTVIGVFIMLTSTATGFMQGLISMFFAGIGCGCLLTSTTKAIMYWFPRKERGTAMGLKQTGVNIGGLLAALTLPVIALTRGWRFSLLIVGLSAILSGVVSFTLYRETSVKERSVASSLRETLNMFKKVAVSRPLLILSCSIAIYLAVEFSLITYLVLNLVEESSLSVVLAGQYLALTEGAGAFGKPLFGALSDILFGGKRKRLLILIGLLMASMCVTFGMAIRILPLWAITAVCILFGLTAIGYGGLYLALVGEIAGKELTGIATGVSTTISLTGIIFGPPLFGYLADITGSYSLSWYLLASAMIVAILLIALVKERPNQIAYSYTQPGNYGRRV